MGKQRALWITQTGVFLAILIVAQALTRPLGNQFVSGSINNMLFILAVMLIGLTSAVVVSVISPIIATIIGIGPVLPPLIPVIIAGNIVLVVLWYFIALRQPERSKPREIAALVVASFTKFLVLYVGIVLLVVPFLLGLPEPRASAVSALFSWPQLVTASIGGVIAMLIYTPLLKALPKNKTR
jgi:ABC-type Co2+ transport system permease subunit